MPLVMLTGPPCSGKSRRAAELVKAFTEAGASVQLVNEESLLIDRTVTYRDSEGEKHARGQIRAAVEKYLNRTNVVVVDSLNYIKGFRYQLFCLAREHETPSCTLFCDVAEDVARQWNEMREDGAKYTDEAIDGLYMRYEQPDARNKWDAPLFVVAPGDPTPCAEIVEAALRGKAVRSLLATKPVVIPDSNFLHELDKATQEIVDALNEAQQSGAAGPGDLVPLRRLRSAFLKIAQLKPPSDMALLGSLFVEYLNTHAD
eukprot:tig00000197_g15686.t1